MKKSKAELDVDFIGGAGPLTKEEEKLISDFINAKKQNTSSKKRIAQQGPGKKATVRTYVQR
jgi:hypothetical protein